MDYLGVSPLLVPALAVARGHLHLLQPLREGAGDGGAAVLAPQLELSGEREELSGGHEVVADVLTKVVAKGFVSLDWLSIYHIPNLSLSSFCKLSRHVLLLGFLNLP